MICLIYFDQKSSPSIDVPQFLTHAQFTSVHLLCD
jgi:hypothetical protein